MSSSSDQVIDGGILQQTPTGTYKKKATSASFSTIQMGDAISQDYSPIVTSTSMAIDANPPDNNLINSKKLCVMRPEIIAALDFKSVQDGSFLGTDTATKLFNERVTKRAMQLESVINNINAIKSSDPDLYNSAVIQYESAIASAAAEIALLKIAYQFKVYAEIGSSFTSWINNYSFDSTIYGNSVSKIPSNSIFSNSANPEFINYFSKTLLWTGEGTTNMLIDTLENGKDATLFLQLLSDLAFSSCYGSPKTILSSRFGAGAGLSFFGEELREGSERINTKIVLVTDATGDKNLNELSVGRSGLVRLSRDLTASVQIGKIAAATGEEDQTLKSILEKYVESDYFSSDTKFSKSLFAKVVGWDPYGSAVSDFSKRGSNEKLSYYMPDFSSYDSGLISRIFTSDRKTIVVSTDSDSYQSRESTSAIGSDYYENSYAGVKDLVQEAFSSNNTGINLGLYNSTIQRLQDNLEDFSNSFLRLFKLLDYVGTSKSADTLLTEDFHTTSPPAIFKSVLKVYSERFASNADFCLGLKPRVLREKYGISADSLGSSPDSLPEAWADYRNDFYKCWGIFLIINFPDISKKIIEKFVEDYKRGYLTFSEDVQVEVNESTGEETEIRNNVLPGTQTATDISNTRGSLYTYLQYLYTDFLSKVESSDNTLNSDIDETESDFAFLEYYSGKDAASQIGIWAPLSPTRAFTGSYNTEENQAEAFKINYPQNLELLFNSEKPSNDLYATVMEQVVYGVTGGAIGEVQNDIGSNASISRAALGKQVLYLGMLQNLHIWWAEAENGTVYPSSILPIAAGVIDAVMTVLYECLSGPLGISPAAASDPVWPSVNSSNAPYTKEWDMYGFYAQSIGSFDGNNSYWIPVLEALKNSVVRPGDLTTYFANREMSTILGGVVDAFASVDPSFNSNFCMMSAGTPTSMVVEGQKGAVPMTNMFFGSGQQTVVSAGNITGGTNRTPFYASIRAKGDTSQDASFNYQGTEYNSSGGAVTAAINWSTYLDTVEMTSGNSGGAGDNAYAAILANMGSVNDYDRTIGGYGIWVFAGLTDSIDPPTVDSSAATPSMWLDKTGSADDWNTIVTTAWLQAVGIIGAMSQVWILMMRAISGDDSLTLEVYEESVSVVADLLNNTFSGDLSFSEELSGMNDVPSNIWRLACYSGNLDNDESKSVLRKILDKSLDEIVNYYENPSLLNQTGEILDPNGSSSAHYDYTVGSNKLSQSVLLVIENFLSYAAEDVRLGVGLDMFRNFADRISKYSETAVDGLTTEEGSEQSALEKLIQDLSATPPGNDVLENLTPRQLTLKSAALERQMADKNQGYISSGELISSKEVDAIKVMLSDPNLLAEEGKNAETFIVGLPAGTLDTVAPPEGKLEYEGPASGTSTIEPIDKLGGKNSPLFGLRYQAQIPDYPLVSFIPKLFRFDSELYVLPGAFENIDMSSVSSFSDLVMKTEFTRIRYMTSETSPGSAEQIKKIDSTAKEKLEDLVLADSSNQDLFDIYSNTLSSYLLEKYYKLMVGFSASEDDFSTAGTGLSIPINEYASDLASALSSIYTDLESDLSQEKVDELFMLSSDIEALSYNALRPDASSAVSSISKYSELVSQFTNEIESGEFTSIDLSSYESFTNSASSRIFSAESMRDKIISAKYFDRVLYVLIDPDEFVIAGEYQYDTENLAGLASWKRLEIRNLYKSFLEELTTLGKIEKIIPEGHDGSTSNYRMTPRTDEGDLSFSSAFCTLVRATQPGDPYDVILWPDRQNDLIVNTVGGV